MGIVEVHQPVPEIDAARRAGAHAEDGLQQLGTAGAHQAVQAEDLALAHIKGDVLQVGRVLGGQVLDGQDGVAGGVVHRREPAFQRTADHGGDQLVHVGLFGGLGHDQVAVAQHRDLVADLEDLVHLVGNVDQRNALRLEHPHHFKQFVNFLHGQRGSGLVQNDHLGVVADRLGDLAHLPLRHRHIAHGLGQVDGHAQLAEQVGGLALHLPLVHDTHRVDRVSAQEQIVDDAALQALVQFLVDHCNAVFQCVLGTGETDLLAVEVDLALILLVGAEQALHHRRLTGAVFAHKSHDSTALYVQVDMVKHPVASERLAHTANGQDGITFRFCHSRYSRFCILTAPQRPDCLFLQKGAIREKCLLPNGESLLPNSVVVTQRSISKPG